MEKNKKSCVCEKLVMNKKSVCEKMGRNKKSCYISFSKYLFYRYFIQTVTTQFQESYPKLYQDIFHLSQIFIYINHIYWINI